MRADRRAFSRGPRSNRPSADGFVGAHPGIRCNLIPQGGPIFRAADQSRPHRVEVNVFHLFVVFLDAAQGAVEEPGLPEFAVGARRWLTALIDSASPTSWPVKSLPDTPARKCSVPPWRGRVARRYLSADGFLRGSSQIRAALRFFLSRTRKKTRTGTQNTRTCALHCFRAGLADRLWPIPTVNPFSQVPPSSFPHDVVQYSSGLLKNRFLPN